MIKQELSMNEKLVRNMLLAGFTEYQIAEIFGMSIHNVRSIVFVLEQKELLQKTFEARSDVKPDLTMVNSTEKAVFELISLGLNNEQITEKLKINIHCVRAVVSELERKELLIRKYEVCSQSTRYSTTLTNIDGITDTEQCVIRLLLTGYTPQQIEQRLNLNEDSVKSVVLDVIQKELLENKFEMSELYSQEEISFVSVIPLNSTEKSVLELLKTGLSPQEISQKIKMSEFCINAVISVLRRKGALQTKLEIYEKLELKRQALNEVAALSESEKTVLELLKAKFTPKQIAQKLNISEHSVKSIVLYLMKKGIIYVVCETGNKRKKKQHR